MTLWRVIFSKNSRRIRDPFTCGPWHPDRSVVEAWAAWFTKIGHNAGIEDNRGWEPTAYKSS